LRRNSRARIWQRRRYQHGAAGDKAGAHLRKRRGIGIDAHRDIAGLPRRNPHHRGFGSSQPIGEARRRRLANPQRTAARPVGGDGVKRGGDHGLAGSDRRERGAQGRDQRRRVVRTAVAQHPRQLIAQCRDPAQLGGHLRRLGEKRAPQFAGVGQVILDKVPQAIFSGGGAEPPQQCEQPPEQRRGMRRHRT
jgi:hypothetical protein